MSAHNSSNPIREAGVLCPCVEEEAKSAPSGDTLTVALLLRGRGRSGSRPPTLRTAWNGTDALFPGPQEGTGELELGDGAPEGRLGKHRVPS